MTDLDCEHCLQIVWEYLDGEMDEARAQEIEAHIADCEHCGPKYEFQRRLKVLIEQKCREGPVPTQLKQRLFRLLDEP